MGNNRPVEKTRSQGTLRRSTEVKLPAMYHATAAVAILVSSGIATSSAHGASNEIRHASGIALVGAGPYQPSATNPEQEIAFNDALRMARENPDDFGYPGIDSKGAVVYRSVTAKGRTLEQ